MWIKTAEGWKQLSPKACKPAPKDDHMLVLKPDTTDAWLASMRTERAEWKQRCKELGIKHWSE